MRLGHSASLSLDSGSRPAKRRSPGMTGWANRDLVFKGEVIFFERFLKLRPLVGEIRLYTTRGTDRRRHPRAEIICPVIIQTKRTVVSGETRNISAGGALIRCRRQLRPDQVINMFINVSPPSPRVLVSARVVRSNISYSASKAGTYDIGVEFRAVSDQDQERISTMVAEHLKSEYMD